MTQFSGYNTASISGHSTVSTGFKSKCEFHPEMTHWHCNTGTSSWHKRVLEKQIPRGIDYHPSDWGDGEKTQISGFPRSSHGIIILLNYLYVLHLNWNIPTLQKSLSLYEVVDCVTGHQTGVPPPCVSYRIKVQFCDTLV